MYTAFDIIMIPLQLLIIFFTLYYFFVSWFGLFGKKKEVKIYNESKTFALIACAHNEERVIAQLVDNLRRLNYNDALYDIYVVADNCWTKQRRLHARPARWCMSASAKPVRARALPSRGCSTDCSSWIRNMMRFAFSMPITWCIPTSCRR